MAKISSTSAIIFSALFFFSAAQAQNKKSSSSFAPEYMPKNYVELKHPAWSRNATIYEVNLRQYTAEGTFKAFEAHLPRLKENGH